MSLRRVVVTGLGAVTPLGLGAEHNWKRLLRAECGITKMNSTGTRLASFLHTHTYSYSVLVTV